MLEALVDAPCDAMSNAIPTAEPPAQSQYGQLSRAKPPVGKDISESPASNGPDIVDQDKTGNDDGSFDLFADEPTEQQDDDKSDKQKLVSRILENAMLLSGMLKNDDAGTKLKIAEHKFGLCAEELALSKQSLADLKEQSKQDKLGYEKTVKEKQDLLVSSEAATTSAQSLLADLQTKYDKVMYDLNQDLIEEEKYAEHMKVRATQKRRKMVSLAPVEAPAALGSDGGLLPFPGEAAIDGV